MYKIQTLNPIAQVGLDRFDMRHYSIANDIDNPDAILVRSFDLHSHHIPSSIKAIGRAGAGTNTIPIERLTLLGIPVFNTPGANANAVKELVLSGLLMASRHLIAAHQFSEQLTAMHQDELSLLVEKEKRRFLGRELPNKTLGIIGLGHIGVKVANAACHLGMTVIGYDPTITVHNAWELSSSVNQAGSLAELLAASDYISLHIPLTETTRHLINDSMMQAMKKGVILLNFAREEIIDRAAVLAHLEKGKIQSYVTDFPHMDFRGHPNVIAFPHLGASTAEAEENCAIMVVDQIRAYLEKGTLKNAVNFPDVKMHATEGFRIAILNQNIPNVIAQISSELSKAGMNIVDMINKSKGDVAYTLIDVNKEPPASMVHSLENMKGILRVRVMRLHHL